MPLSYTLSIFATFRLFSFYLCIFNRVKIFKCAPTVLLLNEYLSIDVTNQPFCLSKVPYLVSLTLAPTARHTSPNSANDDKRDVSLHVTTDSVGAGLYFCCCVTIFLVLRSLKLVCSTLNIDNKKWPTVAKKKKLASRLYYFKPI